MGGAQTSTATVAPECQVWVSSLASSNLTFIDTWTSAPSTITLNGNPSIADFTFNRTGTKIFVATTTGLRMIDLATLGESTIASGIYALGAGDFGAIAASPTADVVIATTNQAVNGAYLYATLNSNTGVTVGASSLTGRSADVVFDPSGNAYAADFVLEAANPPGRIDKINVAVPTTSAFTNFNLAFWEAYSTAAIAAPAGQTPILFVGSNQNTGAADNYFLRAIDTANVTISATVSLTSSPSGMAVSADGEQLFVSQLQLDQVRVFDTVTRAPGVSISVGDGPAAMAVTPDGRYLYVLNSIAGTMSKIDTATLAVVATIPLVPNPSRIAIGPAGCVSVEPQAAPAAPPIVPVWRASLDPAGGVCTDGGVSRTASWTSAFVGYRYLPGESDCSRSGYTFSGWARTSSPSTVVSLPVLDDPADGARRAFVSENVDLVAVWTALPEVKAPTVFGAYPGFFCRNCGAWLVWNQPANATSVSVTQGSRVVCTSSVWRIGEWTLCHDPVAPRGSLTYSLVASAGSRSAAPVVATTRL